MKTIYKIVILVSVILHVSCSKKEENKAVQLEKQVAENKIALDSISLKNIKHDTVKITNEIDELVVVGEVSFDEDNIIRVFPIVSGSVESIKVSLGDYVKKGDHLATIISTDINQYQTDFNIAKSNFLVAEKNLKRIKELYNTNFASEKELTEAQNEYNNAKSQYDGKKQVLELYGGNADNNDATFRVNAPISGYIVERTINEGTQIRTDNNTSMFTISNLKTVWVWANVYESDISRVAPGDLVEVVTVAYPDKIFEGKIIKIGSTLDPEARVVKVRIDLENPEELLKPEMFATVTIKPLKNKKILSVAKNAVFIENSLNKVVRKNTDNTYEKVEIIQGKMNSKSIEVLEGINEGDVVVSEGSLFISTAINNK